MDKVSILKVRDKDEDQEALAIVRSVNGFVALTLSLEHNGDVQVAFTASECRELVELLQQAIFDVQAGVLVTNKKVALAHQEMKEIELAGHTNIGSKNR